MAKLINHSITTLKNLEWEILLKILSNLIDKIDLMEHNQIEVFTKKEEIYLLKTLTIKHCIQKMVVKKMVFIIHSLDMKDGNWINNKVKPLKSAKIVILLLVWEILMLTVWIKVNLMLINVISILWDLKNRLIQKSKNPNKNLKKISEELMAKVFSF